MASETIGICVFCPTQWTVLADNYEVLLTVWEELQEFPLDSETKAQIVGTEAQWLTLTSYLVSPWVH